MYKTLTIDIETIPAQRKDIHAYIAKNVKHPGTISKPESIAKWNEESRPAAIEEAINKTGLDGAFGKIVCVGLAIDDADPICIYGIDEYVLLTGLNRWLSAIPSKEYLTTTVVGHNVAAFDLRFLMQRHIVNGIKPHQIIKLAAGAKPWESERVYDTMVQFAGVGNRISLDKLCMALDLPGKGEVTGADVWPMVQAGRLDEVATYCIDDVRKTRDVFKHMTFQ